MPLFYVTFMQYHPLKDNWVEVEAVDMEEAREKVLHVFGQKFAFVYPQDMFMGSCIHFPGGKVGRTIK
jgi:hypothetical protein